MPTLTTAITLQKDPETLQMDDAIDVTLVRHI